MEAQKEKAPDEAHLVHLASLLSLGDQLPQNPEALEALRQALPGLFQLAVDALSGEDPYEYIRALGLIGKLLPLVGTPEDLPEEAWARVGPSLDSGVLRKLLDRGPDWLPPVARVAPELVSLPPREHPERKETAILSLKAVLEAYPDGIDEEEIAAFLPEALERGYWSEALERAADPLAYRRLSLALGKGLGKVYATPLFRGLMEALLPKASPKALAFLLAVLPEGGLPPLRLRLAEVFGRPEERSSLARAIMALGPKGAARALGHLEALGLLASLMEEGGWLEGFLERREGGQVRPLGPDWSSEELLSLLPVPVARELLRRTNSRGKAKILKALGERLPEEDWKPHLLSPSERLHKASAMIHARVWCRHLVQELEERGYRTPFERDLLKGAEASYRDYGKPPATLWIGENLLVWNRMRPEKTWTFFLFTPQGWLGLDGPTARNIPDPPSPEEALQALARPLGLSPEAIRFLLGLGGKKAVEALRVLSRTEGPLGRKKEALRWVLAPEEMELLDRILLAGDLLRV